MIQFPDIADIRQPEPPPAPDYTWLWWLGASLAAAGLLVWAIRGIRALRIRLQFPPLPGRPDRVALDAIAKLRTRLPELAPAALAEDLSAVIRVFLHRRTGVLANYSTSAEILGDRPRPDQPPPPPVVEKFRSVLVTCDEVRFAAVPLSPTDAERLLDAAAAAVRESVIARPAPAPPSAQPPPLPADAISS